MEWRLGTYDIITYTGDLNKPPGISGRLIKCANVRCLFCTILTRALGEHLQTIRHLLPFSLQQIS